MNLGKLCGDVIGERQNLRFRHSTPGHKDYYLYQMNCLGALKKVKLWILCNGMQGGFALN